jgi:hypothetical protein
MLMVHLGGITAINRSECYPLEVNDLIFSCILEGATSCRARGLLVCYLVTFYK